MNSGEVVVCANATNDSTCEVERVQFEVSTRGLMAACVTHLSCCWRT